MNYKAVVEVDKKTLERWNFLLSKDIDDMTNEEKKKYNVKKYDQEGGFCVDFDDGSYVTIDLESGGNNYYDEIIWHSADENKCINFDCKYKIGGEQEELEIEENLYIIEWEMKK